jgi:hypothetical protein
MSNTHDVISALLDDEPFDPDELLEALSDPDGRALLIDLVALRRIVQPREAVPTISAPSAAGRRSWRWLAAAAALIIALSSGYAAGLRRASDTSREAPPATRIVQAVPFTPTGGTP